MYEEHWKLSERPFENRFSTNFYYPSESHQAALLKLRFSIENRRSVAIVCGNSGMGKSMIVQQLRGQMPEIVGAVVHVAYPALAPDQFVHYIASQLASDDATTPTPASSMSASIQSIEKSLARTVQSGRHTVFVIDEAEWLEDQGTLDTLRLLLNLSIQDTSGEAAFTVLLSGQPSLIAQLERHPALDQRVAVRCMLNRFLIDETNSYIGHRLRSAHGSIEAIFQSDALDAIHHLCEGVPRRINSLCDLALMVGYAQEQSTIKLDLIENVHRELAPIA
ncbi:MAG: AAA family ATPase [Pirellulaceae bacterium]|nr:AAA family ATPase [Pirellulaceae bacterium]